VASVQQLGSLLAYYLLEGTYMWQQSVLTIGREKTTNGNTIELGELGRARAPVPLGPRLINFGPFQISDLVPAPMDLIISQVIATASG
jgi:hypothetical protein